MEYTFPCNKWLKEDKPVQNEFDSDEDFDSEDEEDNKEKEKPELNLTLFPGNEAGKNLT